MSDDTYEQIIEKLEDMELAQIVKAREHQAEIEVDFEGL